MTPNPLARELETYRVRKDELRLSVPDHFVVIKGDKLIGTFAREEDAFARGYELFEREAFLVKQVTEHETVLNFTSFTVSF